MMDNNWKDYEVKPDEGMFDAIRRRLVVRRALRIGGVALAAMAVALVVVVSQNTKTATNDVEANQVASVAVVSQTAADEVIPTAVDDADVPAPARKAEATMATEKPLILPLSREELPTISEPVNDDLFDESLFSGLAETPVSVRREPAKPVAAGDSVKTEPAQAQPKENAATAKVGATDPVPYQEDNILWAPNIITPSGDVAENRVFKVVATSDVSDFRIHIYNRGGRLIFKSGDINMVWDATHNGTPVPQGAYVWVATFRGTDGSSHREAGTVTVVW